MLYKIRKLTSNNKSGDSLGLTIPREIAIKNQNIYFRIMQVGDDILLASGAKL